MRRALLALLLLGPGAASAGDLELSVMVGPAFPTYEQTFAYDPSSLIPAIPGVTIRQEGTFALDASGGLAAGASLAFFPTEAFGIEARFDSVGIDVEVTGAQFTAQVALPGPLPSFTTSLDLTEGQMEVDRVTPLSFGIKLRTPGSVRLTASGGLSYLPELHATARVAVGVGLPNLPGIPSSLRVTTVDVAAGAEPTEGGSRWGWNAGVGLQVALGRSVSFAAEGRFFRFPEQTLTWQVADSGVLGPVEQALAQLARERLPPVEFAPTFFQATAGITLRF
jgi:hypothetical protein